ncbi:hypothetical protein JHK84_050209 [Glycine max]|nr:hypothetical protein JHK84_050209 [Glycine max]
MHDDIVTYLLDSNITTQTPFIIPKWVPPVVGVTKLNIDRSCIYPSNNIGSVGVLRNHTRWIFGFASFDGVRDPKKVELLEIFHGLRVARDCDLRVISYKVDSSNVHGILAVGTCHPFHVHASTVSKILDLLHCDWEISFSLVDREANKVAHFLVSVRVLEALLAPGS